MRFLKRSLEDPIKDLCQDPQRSDEDLTRFLLRTVQGSFKDLFQDPIKDFCQDP